MLCCMIFCVNFLTLQCVIISADWIDISTLSPDSSCYNNVQHAKNKQLFRCAKSCRRGYNNNTMQTNICVCRRRNVSVDVRWPQADIIIAQTCRHITAGRKLWQIRSSSSGVEKLANGKFNYIIQMLNTDAEMHRTYRIKCITEYNVYILILTLTIIVTARCALHANVRW